MAILPELLLVYVYRRDVYQKEPIGLLAKVFFYGFFVVFLCAIVGELLLFQLSARLVESQTILKFLQIAVVCPLVEEVLKF